MKRPRMGKNTIYAYLAILLAIAIYLLISYIEIKALRAGTFTEVNICLPLTTIKWYIMSKTFLEVKKSL